MVIKLKLIQSYQLPIFTFVAGVGALPPLAAAAPPRAAPKNNYPVKYPQS